MKSTPISNSINDVNEQSLSNENLLMYLNKGGDFNNKKKKGTKRQFKAESLIFEANETNEQ